jgi:hypothetical protein
MSNHGQRFSEADDTSEDADADGSGPAALGRLEKQWEELIEYVSYYLAVRLDAARSSLWRAAILLAAGLLALAVAGGFLVACVVMGVMGLAQLVGVALGDRPWAGNLVTGFGLLAICALAVAIGMMLVNHRFREKTARRHAQRRAQQRERFGHDVRQQADTGRRDAD